MGELSEFFTLFADYGDDLMIYRCRACVYDLRVSRRMIEQANTPYMVERELARHLYLQHQIRRDSSLSQKLQVPEQRAVEQTVPNWLEPTWPNRPPWTPKIEKPVLVADAKAVPVTTKDVKRAVAEVESIMALAFPTNYSERHGCGCSTCAARLEEDINEFVCSYTEAEDLNVDRPSWTPFALRPERDDGPRNWPWLEWLKIKGKEVHD